MPHLVNSMANKLGVKLVVPFYHIVSDTPVPHTRYLYPCKTVAQFRADIKELLRQFAPVDIVQVKQHIDGSRPLQRPSFLLTFDDGLRQCRELIAPVLLEMGVPAVFFVNTGFLDNTDMLYRMKASILADSVAQKNGKYTVSVEGLNWSVVTPKNLLNEAYPDRHLLDVVAEQLGVNFEEYRQRYKPYMDTAQVQWLHKQGFAIGGHTHSHPDFRYLSCAEQMAEARQCLLWLKEKAGIDTRLFSFPFTDFWTGDKFFKELGSEIDLFFGSAGLKLYTHGGSVNRVDFENFRNPSCFLFWQMGAYFVKSVIGRHRAKRFGNA